MSAAADSSAALLQDEYVYFLEFAAMVIQRHWRGHRVRKAFYAQRRAEYDRYESERRAELAYLRQDAAARRIQGAWQSYRNRRIYQYYHNLIQFRERGDPREMMRAVNPREAELMDPAAGVHVRFRLGGAFFPPLVFYKVFTHRSVTDINAFGPRNYAQEISATARQRHSKPAPPSAAERKAAKKKQFSEDFEIDATLREYIKPDGTLGYRSTRGWYERVENNGWRPIAERVLLGEDAVTAATKLKRLPFFHYDPAVRREERIRRAKQRKREWLRKMYAQTTGGGDDPSMPPLPGSSLVDLPDEELDDLQVEELLEWSQHLDFHTYLSDWTSMACTMGSESFQPTPELANTVSLPAPDLDVRAAMVAAGVSLQPFKGGATAAAGMPVFAR